MTRYRKKPIVVEAVQWFKNGDHPHDYDEIDSNSFHDSAFRKSRNWEGMVVKYFMKGDAEDGDNCKECGVPYYTHGWIDTKEGGHIVCPGDWIITGIKGERYPCKPDIFEETYELVEEIK